MANFWENDPIYKSSTLSKIAGAESDNRNIDNLEGTSSATGIYQMTKGTFDLVKNKYPEFRDVTFEDFKADPDVQTRMSQKLLEENAKVLRNKGIPETDINQYSMWFSGSTKLAEAPDDAPIESVLTKEQIAANKNVQGKTVGEVRSFLQKRLGEEPKAEGKMPWENDPIYKEFKPGEKLVKGAQIGTTGLKSMWENANLNVDARKAVGDITLVNAFNKIDSGEITDPKDLDALNLTPNQKFEATNYLRSPEKGRETLKQLRIEDFGKRKDFIDASIKTIEQYKKETAKLTGDTPDFTDIADAKDFGNWLAQNASSSVVQLAPVIIAAYTGGAPLAAGLGTTMALGETINNRVDYILGKNKDKSPEDQAAAVMNYIEKTNDVNMLVALGSGMFDLAGPVGSVLRNKAAKELVKYQTKREALKAGAKEVPRAVGEEFLTGGAQELTQITGEKYLGEQDKDFLSPENIKRVLDAAAAEAVGGGIGGGAVAVQKLGSVESKDLSEKISKDPIVEPASKRVEPTMAKPAEEFAEAPAIEVRGVGQVPESEALDYAIMMAEAEGAPEKPAVEAAVEAAPVEEPVAEVVAPKEEVKAAEEPVPEKIEPVSVAGLPPEDAKAIRTLEIEANKVARQPSVLYQFLKTQGIQPSEKPDLGVETGKRGNRPTIFRTTAPSFDVLASRAIDQGLMAPSGDDVQDVANFREIVSDYLNYNRSNTPADLDKVAQLQTLQDEINRIKEGRKEEFGLTQPTPLELRAQEEARKAQEDAEIDREMAEKARQSREEIARRSQAAAGEFELGRTAEEDLTGQKRLVEDDDIPFNFERIVSKQLFTPDEMQKSPSLRVEMNRLVKANKEGKVSPESFAMRVEQIIDSTKKERKFKPRERGEDIIIEKLRRANRRGELSPEAIPLTEWFIRQNPALVDDVSLSIKEPKEGQVASGFYNPASRIVTLIKGSGNIDTAVHEILHHTERMMPADIQKAIRKAWAQSLMKASKAAQEKNKQAPSLEDENNRKYFQSIIDYHFNDKPSAIKEANRLLQNGDVGYENYQYLNPSEFWAVNASDIVAKRYEATNSIVGKLKRWLAEFAETIKNLFGLDNKAPLIKALNSLAKADGKFVSQDMLGKAVDYASIHRNYKGDMAPLATWGMPKETKLDWWLYRIQDKYIDVKDAQKAIREQIGEIDDKWDVYLKEELYHGKTATQAKEFLNNELMPILNEMAEKKVNLQDFDNYLHNRHAQEYNEYIAKKNPELPDGGSGILTADAQAYLANLDPETLKTYESLAKKVDSIVKGTQDILVKSGVEEPETINAWNKTFKKYVPLFRKDLDFAPPSGSGMGQGFGVRGAFSKQAMGSTKDVADIFANIAAQRERAIVRAQKAEVGRALYGLAIKNPNPGFWLPVSPDAIKNKSALKKELVNMGLNEEDADSIIQEPKSSYIDPKTGLVAYRVNPLLRSSNNVFPVRINGKDRYIFFNPSDERAMRMATALKNLDADQLGTIMGTFAKITRWMASVNTQYNPVFGAYNFLRDVGGAQFNLTTTPIAGKQLQVDANVLPALKAIYSELRGERKGKKAGESEMAKLWQEFRREGGITGYRDQFSKTKEEASILQKELDKLMEPKGKAIAMAPLRSLFSWLSDYNESLENAVRLAAYKVALDQGLSKERAASLAKNLTVNFNRKGAKTAQANALYAFFNASVQGTTRLAETLKGPAKKKIIAGGLLLGAMQALILAAAGFDEDEPPEFIKDRNIIIPFGDGKYFAVPMPLGLHVIPSTGRSLTEFILSGGKDPGKRTANLLGLYLDAFNPVGNSGLSMQMVSPTALDPLAALAENRDAFGRPIYKKDRSETDPTPGYTRTRDNASTISKYLSEFLNYASGGTKYQKGLFSPTPDQIDYLVGQATGGVGREAQKIEQLITDEEEVPPHKIPLVGKFYGDAASQSAQKNKFYANVVKMANFENEIKGRQKDRVSTADVYEENPEARLWRMANRVENEISDLNQQKKKLKEQGAPAERIKRIEEIKLRKMQQFNERVAEAEAR